MSLSEEALGMGCLNWWIDITERASRPIILGKPDIVIASDNSLTRYGTIDNRVSKFILKHFRTESCVSSS